LQSSDPIQSVIEFIKRVSSNPEYCSRIASEILSITGHIPVAYNIARGAGFCSYFARMVETIGVKESVPLRYSGKGKVIHQILGLASFYLFRDGWLPPSLSDISSSIERAVNELTLNHIIQNIEEGEIVKAKLMLKNLVSLLPRCLQIIESNATPFKAIVEQQFVDYKIHIRGVPDLILENREQKKAVVVEWKTSEGTVAKWEEAQVLAYALLAARRLGYEPDEAISKILGKYDESTKEFSGIDILPVIIRPTTTEKATIKPHPVFSGLSGEDLIREYTDFKKLLYNVRLEAEHLTILNFNVFKLSAEEHESIRRNCKATTKNGEIVNSLRYTPFQLPRGNPSKQDKFPCTICANEIKEACKYYFGRGFSVQDEADKTMWQLRFRVYEKLESMLLQYRAIQEAFMQRKELILEELKNGYGFVYDLRGKYIYRNKKVGSANIMIMDKSNKMGKIKIDILDRIGDFRDKNFTIIVNRGLREYEKDSLTSTLKEDKTGLLVILDCEHPLLSPNLFCRIDEVLVENNEVTYILGLPSPLFKYNYLLFKSYVESMSPNEYSLMLVEVGANLLHLELKIIDIMQRELNNVKVESNMNEDEFIGEYLNKFKQEVETEYFSRHFSLMDQLREIISKGANKKGGVTA